MTHLQFQLILALFAAHLIGDFVLQSRESTENRSNFWVLLRHSSTVTALSYLLVGAWPVWEIPVTILITHTLIDFVKTRSNRDGIIAFSLDQLTHIAVIVAIALWIGRDDTLSLFWLERSGVTTAFVIVAGAVAATAASAVLIETVLRPFQQDLSSELNQRGFPGGGRTIGNLERFLIFVLVMADQAGAVGFLIAAKSIFRFGELQKRENRQEAEYIIIGTMWSFVCGLVVSLIARWLLNQG